MFTRHCPGHWLRLTLLGLCGTLLGVVGCGRSQEAAPAVGRDAASQAQKYVPAATSTASAQDKQWQAFARQKAEEALRARGQR